METDMRPVIPTDRHFKMAKKPVNIVFYGLFKFSYIKLHRSISNKLYPIRGPLLTLIFACNLLYNNKLCRLLFWMFLNWFDSLFRQGTLIWHQTHSHHVKNDSLFSMSRTTLSKIGAAEFHLQRALRYRVFWGISYRNRARVLRQLAF